MSLRKNNDFLNSIISVQVVVLEALKYIKHENN